MTGPRPVRRADAVWMERFAALGIERPAPDVERMRLKGKVLPLPDAPPDDEEQHLRLVHRLVYPGGPSYRWVALVLGGNGLACEGVRGALLTGLDLGNLEELRDAASAADDPNRSIEMMAEEVRQVANEDRGTLGVLLRGMLANLRRNYGTSDQAEGSFAEITQDMAAAIFGMSPFGGFIPGNGPRVFGPLAYDGEMQPGTPDAVPALARFITEAPLEQIVGPMPLMAAILRRVILPALRIDLNDDEIACAAALITPGCLAAQPGFWALMEAQGGLAEVTERVAHGEMVSPPT